MKRQVVGVSLLVLCVVWFSGCGGNQSQTVASGPDEQTITSGLMEIGVAATAGFKQLPIPTPASSSVALTAFYGSKITRLAQMGPGKIAFSLEGSRIATINPDGSSRVLLTPAGTFDRDPAWSPSGNKIAFSSYRNANRDLYVMSSAGGAAVRVTTSPFTDASPSWSPGGDMLAYECYANDNYEVFVTQPGLTGGTNWTNSPGNDISPAWSPDGKEILFASERDGDYELFARAIDGGLRKLTTNSVIDADPSWSPDGQRIVFRSDAGLTNEIRVMNADGGGQAGLGVVGFSPRFTWDGREIVFERDNDLYIMRANGTRVRRVGEVGQAGKPACSPTPGRARTLVGAAGEDAGANPPFGNACHLAITGLTDADGLVEAAALLVPDWSPLKVSTPNYGGNSLTAVVITGTALGAMVEDRGRAVGVRRWTFPAKPATGSVTVFFSASTGQIRSILTASDSVAPAAVSGAKSGQIVLSGPFTSVLDARDPVANLAKGLAREVTIDANSGQVLSTQ